MRRQKAAQEELKRRERRRRRRRRRLLLTSGGGDEEDEDGDADEGMVFGHRGKKKTAAASASLKVRHTADELAAGETVVLTLADASILNERGELNEDGDDGDGELEEATRAEAKRGAAAKFAAENPLAAPLWEEDGVSAAARGCCPSTTARGTRWRRPGRRG